MKPIPTTYWFSFLLYTPCEFQRYKNIVSSNVQFLHDSSYCVFTLVDDVGIIKIKKEPLVCMSNSLFISLQLGFNRI
jgi:hypothetical protein